MAKVFARCLNLFTVALVAVALFATESHSGPLTTVTPQPRVETFRSVLPPDMVAREVGIGSVPLRNEIFKSPSAHPQSGTIREYPSAIYPW